MKIKCNPVVQCRNEAYLTVTECNTPKCAATKREAAGMQDATHMRCLHVRR